MPKTVIIPDPDAANTIGAGLAFVRTGPGNAGIAIRYDVPGEPGGTFEVTGASLTAGELSNLAAIHAKIITLFKAARGYV